MSSTQIADDNAIIIGKIKEVLNTVRPYLQSDGGDIKYIKFSDGILYVKMIGACVGCGLIANTMNDGIKMIMLDEVPEVLEIEMI